MVAKFRLSATIPAALTLFALGACTDLPSSPTALRILADGRQWVAVAPPERLPDVAMWLPYVSGAAEGGGAAAEVGALQAAAERARREGNPGRAADLRGRALATAVRSLSRSPEPAVFESALGALDQWTARARSTAVAEADALASAVSAVETGRARAAAALTAGDSTAAVAYLGGASEIVREWSPAEVALRVLARAEEAMVSSTRGAASRERVRHLARSARQELVDGDPVRALRRALYALQLAAGGGLPDSASPD